MNKIFEVIVRETGGLVYISLLTLVLVVVSQIIIFVRYFVLKQNTREIRQAFFTNSIVLTFILGAFLGCYIGVKLVMY